MKNQSSMYKKKPTPLKHNYGVYMYNISTKKRRRKKKQLRKRKEERKGEVDLDGEDNRRGITHAVKTIQAVLRRTGGRNEMHV